MNDSMDSYQEALKLLVGYRFNPTDEILLEHYLFNKIHSLPYSSLVVFYCDLYGDSEPWEIWNSYGGVDGQDLYFFTRLKRSMNSYGQLSAHVNRKIGPSGGTWSGENSTTSISGTEVPRIGYCKQLRYENPQVRDHHGEWIMHEYSLHESMIISGCSDPNYVLCRIRKNERPKRKARQTCNIRPMKKIVSTPKIEYDMGRISTERQPRRSKTNKKQFSSKVQLAEQRGVTPNMKYPVPCDPTNQITPDVSYLALLTTDEGISDMPCIPEIMGETTDMTQWISEEFNFDCVEEDFKKIQWASEVLLHSDSDDDTKYDESTIFGLSNELWSDAIVEQGTKNVTYNSGV